MTLQRLSVLLDERLEALTVGQIRAALQAHAATPAAAQRQAFLDIFTAAVAPSSPADRSWPVEEDPLLVDIDAFAAAVASGSYYGGYGWDPDLRDQRSFGDESWVGEMDGLFGDAQQAFLGGELGLARAAYGRLLDALRLDEEVGTFCGPEPAEDMLGTNIQEAQGRYLRAVYETERADERAEVLAEQWLALPDWRATPTLRGLREALPEDVPDLEAFLPQWISALVACDEGRPQVRRLLAEAVELSRGVDGLGELARAGGPGQAKCYADWITGLRRAARDPDAAQAAWQALEVLPAGGHVCAGIADQLAELCVGQADALLAARREAWRAAATQQRLLDLAGAAAAVDDVERVLTAEAEAVPGQPLSDRLICRVTSPSSPVRHRPSGSVIGIGVKGASNASTPPRRSVPRRPAPQRSRCTGRPRSVRPSRCAGTSRPHRT